MRKETGGPAFPCETLGVDEHGSYRKPYEGMTLRDHFAGLAMHGLITGGSTNPVDVAKAAYIVADAMMKAREQ